MMNSDVFTALAGFYRLGDIVAAPKPVKGGRSHKVWKIVTSNGEFAVKKLMTEKEETSVNNLRYVEHLASELADNGFPALSALQCQGDPLCLLNGDCYAVYQWIKARSFPPKQLTAGHVHLVAKTLKQLHLSTLSVQRLKQQQYTASTQEAWRKLAAQALKHQLPYAAMFSQQVGFLSELDKKADDAFNNITNDEQVISHGDMDPYNVLWTDQQSFFIIDWELANKAPVTVDFLTTLLYWSLNDANHIDWLKIAAFVEGYQFKSSQNLLKIFYIVLGQWLSWFQFNVNRAMDLTTDKETKKISLVESQKTLNAVVYLFPLLPSIVACISQSARP